MSLELSIKQLTLSIDILISILDKSNQDSNADLNSVITPVIKMASEIIMEPAPTPTIKVAKPKLTPIVTADETVTNIVEQPAVALDILGMRDAIRTMCSEMVQSDKKNKVGIEDIFSKFKATHLKMVNDATVPALYAHVLVFKGALK
jgi:hypothetical protein